MAKNDDPLVIGTPPQWMTTPYAGANPFAMYEPHPGLAPWLQGYQAPTFTPTGGAPPGPTGLLGGGGSAVPQRQTGLLGGGNNAGQGAGFEREQQFGDDPRRNMGIPEFQGTFGDYLGTVLGGLGMVASPMTGLAGLALQDAMGYGLSGAQGPMGAGQLASRALKDRNVDPYTGLPTGGGGGNDDRGSNPNDLGRTGYTSGMREPKTGRMVGGV